MPNDTLKVLKLAKLAKEYSKLQTDSSLKIGNDALTLAQSLKYEYGVAYSFYILSIVNRYYGDYDKSIECSEKSYKLFKILNNEPYKGMSLNSLGNLYKRTGDYKASLSNFLQGLRIFNELKDSLLISAAINNIANLYVNMKQYDKALEYQFRNLEIKKKLELHDKIPIVLMNIGVIYNGKKEYEVALNYYKEALGLIPVSVNNYDKLLIINSMGVVFHVMDRYSEAINYYQKALELEQKIGDKSIKISTLQNLGLLLIKTGKFSEGEKYLMESFLLANELGELRKQSNVALKLRWFYENQKQYKKSLKYSKLYIELKDSILDLEKIKQITSLEQKHEAEKREHKIITLEKEQALQQIELTKKELENGKKSLQKKLLIVTVILVLLFALYCGIENKKSKKINGLLKMQNRKILDQRTEIAKQNNELIESNKTKDKLFQIIAHDLRSPLTTVESIAHLIPYWLDNHDFGSLYKLSETFWVSVNNVLSLVDDLLNWALKQQNNFPISSRNFYLNETIINSIASYSPIAEIKNISLKFECFCR